MTYEGLFDFLKRKEKVVKTDSDKEIIDTCKDILIELGDIGYTYNVDGYKRHNNNILTKPRNESMNEVEIKIRLLIPDKSEKEIEKMILDGDFTQISDYYDRLSSYLSSQGFKLTHDNWNTLTKGSSENYGVVIIDSMLMWFWTAEYN